ncbi:MAG: CehA/McbA family metallohydrolase [Microthrixaceae bacterium]
MRWGARWTGIGLSVALAAGAPAVARAVPDDVPACAPDGAAVVVTGSVSSDDAKTYRDLPFDVAPGTTRVEVGYRWDDARPLPGTPANVLVQTVLDLGLWDEGGVGSPAGFRGWSGSRQGKTATGQPPIWVQADTAERGYRPGPVEPGIWNVDLGIAAVAPAGASYEVVVRCLNPAVGPAVVAQPVDASHIADAEAGWYHGDFHMHGYHSSPSAPTWTRFAEYARAAGLDFLPVTEYVTDQHQRELGPIQTANPDLLIWPGREVITYFGHATVFGETPSVVDWRHGAPGVTLRDIQTASVGDGALFGVAHPTIFPTPIFGSFCRGCEFTLGDDIDWDQVATIEVLTGPILVDDKQIGGPGLGRKIENPFVPTAIDLWQRKLLEGHKITAVSGSDDKLGPDLGSSATAVYAQQLSRPALIDAIRAGRAYVRTQGAHRSPTVELTATTATGEHAMVGDTLVADAARMTARVQGGAGQTLAISADGVPAGTVLITGDDVTIEFLAVRLPQSGPLGTFWRVDTVAPPTASTGPYRTTIGNPIFLSPG